MVAGNPLAPVHSPRSVCAPVANEPDHNEDSRPHKYSAKHNGIFRAFKTYIQNKEKNPQVKKESCNTTLG